MPSRRRTFLEDDWSIGGTKSLLGAALVQLARYDEAEAMLLEARTDLETTSAPASPELKTTLSRLVELHVSN